MHASFSCRCHTGILKENAKVSAILFKNIKHGRSTAPCLLQKKSCKQRLPLPVSRLFCVVCSISGSLNYHHQNFYKSAETTEAQVVWSVGEPLLNTF